MIFTVGVVVVNEEAFVDPRLDIETPVIREILSGTAQDPDSFEILTVNVVPQREEEILIVVRNLIETSSVDWIVVIGGIGLHVSDCAPEVSDSFKHSTK